MGNHRLKQHQYQINTVPPIVSKMTVVETQKQHVGVGVTKSPNARITTIGVKMVVAPNINVVKKGVLIGFVTKLGSGLGGVSTRRNLNRSSVLPIATIRIVGT
jgi:hypothetical protein